jgi:macrolide transport system ATP-binding/permease protein
MKWWQIRRHDIDLGHELHTDLSPKEELPKTGLSAKKVGPAASLLVEDITLPRDKTRKAWGVASFERVMQDAQYALRQLWRSPGFSIIAILTLAVGIGTTTAMFTLVYDVMLRPLPFPQADRLVTIEEKVAEWSNMYPTVPVSANHFAYWQTYNNSFKAMAIMQQVTMPLGGSGRPLQVEALQTTPGFFSVVGIQPNLGRGFTAVETQTGHGSVAVLTYDLWREHFSGDASILGKTILLDGSAFHVIGVMPQSFHMPSLQTMGSFGGSNRHSQIGVLLPLELSKARLSEQMGDLNYFGLGRLKPGVSIIAAGAELNALQRRISDSLPADEEATLSSLIAPYKDKLVGNNRKPLIILLVAVVGLLLVGCVNVANLLLSRAISHKRQFAIASALGANRTEMVRMALRETIMLAALGGGLGVLLAAGIVPSMQQYLPAALDFRGSLHVDRVGVACALLLAVVATLAAGGAPAFMVSRTAPQEVLHSDSRLTKESLRSRRARHILIAFEAAVSVALVLTTGLLITSMTKLLSVDSGFTSDRTITATVNLPSETYNDDQRRESFYREVVERISGLGGVQSVAFSSVLPLAGGGWGQMARVIGDGRPSTQLALETVRSISPQYFSAIGLPMIAGATFSEGDRGKNVALISEKTAKNLWPGKNPLGQQFNLGDPANEKPFTVVGVVGDARTISLAEPDPMLIYVPYWYRCDSTGGILVRTHQDPSQMSAVIRQTIWSIDQGVPVPTVRALGSLIADSVASRQFELDLLLVFAVSALLLAGLGIYGVLTYSVSQRYGEMALRLALGAQRGTVYWLVLRDGIFPVAIGATGGIAVVFGSARIIRGLLFQVSPYDPILTISAVSVLLVVAIIACLLPAYRAAAVEPMQALRTE